MDIYTVMHVCDMSHTHTHQRARGQSVVGFQEELKQNWIIALTPAATFFPQRYPLIKGTCGVSIHRCDTAALS